MTSLQQYQQTLDYLFKQLPMFQRIGPAAFKKDLTNIQALSRHLGDPHRQYPCIHIAGTNGKGSVAHMLAAVLQAHGLKTGLYTSPHYRDFRERIKIDGMPAARKYIVDFVTAHKEFFSTLQPSFFEITVAMAFDYFAREEIDVAVIETGLGGRLDSTNIVEPLISIITNISYDHQQFLGDTLPLIAREKAGIIKSGAPVVIGETHPETIAVFKEKAAAEKTSIVFADQLYEARLRDRTMEHTIFDLYRKGKLKQRELSLNTLGEYQSYNLQTVLASFELIAARLGLEVRESQLRTGLKELRKLTRFIGRWQVIGREPLILCDSAHNEGGLQQAIRQLKEQSFQRLHVVFGMVNDKEPEKILKHFPKDARYYFAKANVPRGLDARELKAVGDRLGLKGRAYVSVRNALKAAREHAGPDDLIFVGGSIFVVAEVI